jgi:hypothetical protein
LDIGFSQTAVQVMESPVVCPVEEREYTTSTLFTKVLASILLSLHRNIDGTAHADASHDGGKAQEKVLVRVARKSLSKPKGAKAQHPHKDDDQDLGASGHGSILSVVAKSQSLKDA